MPAPSLIEDKTLSLNDLTDALNAGESFAATQSARVYALIQARENPDANKVVYEDVPGGSTARTLSLRDFDLEIAEDPLIDAVAAHEAAQTVQAIRVSPAWVAGNLRMVAIFAPIPAAAAVVPLKTKVVTGKMSRFGGEHDTTMLPEENLALVWDAPSAARYPGWFFTPAEKPQFPGYARRLKPGLRYIAIRWQYSETPKSFLHLPTTTCTVINPANGKKIEGVRPIDWGPNQDTTGRDIDLSPQVIQDLGLKTDDICTVWVPLPGQAPVLAKPAAAVAGTRNIVWLTGDYSERARQAGKEHCTHSIDFHFNGFDQPAFGGEVYYKNGSAAAQSLAAEIWARYLALGRPPHGSPVKNAQGSRAKYINGYPCHAVLLEPLFITEQAQATWLRDPANLEALSLATANAIKAKTGAGDVIGLSIGHLGKTSNPSDRGTASYFAGEWEGDYNKRMAQLVAKHLQTA